MGREEMQPQWISWLLQLLLVASGLCHQCYVCSPDDGKAEDLAQLSKFFPDTQVPSCSQYRPHLAPHYLLDCPPATAQGCLTKFEGSSVMRTCAPVAIDDCKTANSVQYCYCSTPGCNSPGGKLAGGGQAQHKTGGGQAQPRTGKHSQHQSREGSQPQPREGSQHSLHSGSVERKALGRTQPGHSSQAFTGKFAGPHFSDDEDVEEGSADWGEFYYDEYNYSDELDAVRLDDTEGGDDYEDVTNPPPFLDLGDGGRRKEESWGGNKYEREEVVNDIELVEENDREAGRYGKGRRRPGSSAAPPCAPWPLLGLLLLLLASSWPAPGL